MSCPRIVAHRTAVHVPRYAPALVEISVQRHRISAPVTL
jgi:hypothetical protein